MTRLVIVLWALLSASTALAGDLAHKATYTDASIRENGISSVESLIREYARAQSLDLDAKSSPALFLVNGQRSELSAQGRDKAVSEARSVEIMSDDTTVVINVIS